MSNNRPLILLALAVLLIVGGSLWFLNSSTPVPSVAGTATPTPTAETKQSTPDPRRVAANPGPVASTGPKIIQQPPKATPRPLQDWELKIDEVLRSSADETQTAQILINMLPTLPAEGQSEAAQHISNLILDDQYNRVLPLVKNPNLPEDVLDVFVTDLMNRDDAVKLPALLDIAKIPNHPHHEEALTDLEIFLDAGDIQPNDWGRWDAAVKDYLRKQAAEEAADNAPAPAGNVPKK
jgi:hypothetical protein